MTPDDTVMEYEVATFLIVLVCLLSRASISQGAIFEGPTTTIAHPGDDVELVCNVTSQFTTFVLWIVNGNLFTRNQLFNGDLPGHNISGTNILILDITLGDSRNGSEYYCVIPQGIVDIESDRAFLYVAASPNMVPGVMADISSISAVPQFPAQPIQFNCTLNWDEPFENFDPILNYTIITSCSDNTVCPVTHVTGSDVTTLDISYTLPIITVNYTISITANNTVGSSDPAIIILAAPSQVQNVSVMCAPENLVNECSVAWNPLSYGPNAVPLPILYEVSYSGINITTGRDTVMSTPHVITLSAVNSSVFVSVTAYNDFGSGGASLAALDDIMSSSVQGTTSVLLEGDTPAETYNVAVVCDISPSSTADYCEAIARNDANTVSASATLNNNDMATANLNGLVCEEMYSIIAGGVITNVAMMDQTLVGPRFHMETITAPACPVGIQTTSVSTVSITVTSTIAIALPPGRSGGSGDNSGAIIGIVVGGICAAMVVVVAIIILIYCCCCRKDDKKSYTVEMHAVGPTHESVQLPLSDEVQMDTNPAYAVSTAGTVKMEGNPAYQTTTTNPGGGAGRGLYYYEDIINDRNVKMTQNPAYAVP